MSDLENAPNMNSDVELNPSSVGSNVVEQKSGTESSPVETPELSLEERVQNLENTVKVNEQEITRLTALVETTKSAVNDARNEVRKKLGLESETIEEDPQSVISDKDRLKKLQDQQDVLEKQKEDLISQQEKEKLIEEEKGKILQQKLNKLFEEFQALNLEDLQQLIGIGRTVAGSISESKSMGSLNPEVAQSLARAFREGIKLLPKILEAEPDLLGKFDEQLTEEATKNVEEKLEAEKQEMKNKQVKKEKPEGSESEISQGEATTKSNPIEGVNTENLK